MFKSDAIAVKIGVPIIIIVIIIVIFIVIFGPYCPTHLSHQASWEVVQQVHAHVPPGRVDDEWKHLLLCYPPLSSLVRPCCVQPVW